MRDVFFPPFKLVLDILSSYNVSLESIGVNVSLAAAGPFTALHLYTNTHAQPLSLQFDFAHAASARIPCFHPHLL